MTSATESPAEEMLARRRPPAGAPLTEVWDRFIALLPVLTGGERSTALADVLANMVALTVYADPEDCHRLVSLADRHGEEELARLHHDAAQLLQQTLEVDIAARFVHRLKAVAFEAAVDVDSEVAARCAAIGARMLLHNIDHVERLRQINTSDELIALIDEPDFAGWRECAAAIMDSPWSPYTRRLIELAEQTNRPDIAATVLAVAEVGREEVRERERREVAEKVRRLIKISGASQNELARRVGTSPARMSTYASGVVTPSAAMLMRIEWQAEVVRRERPKHKEQASG